MGHRIFNTERWHDNEVQKLYSVIQKYEKSGVIFLSGDVHHAQFVSTQCRMKDIGYELFEVVTSGLTHTCDRNLEGNCLTNV